jgi:transposase
MPKPTPHRGGGRVDLTDAQWEFIAPLLPKYRQRKDGRGLPRKDLREVLHGILWILRRGPVGGHAGSLPALPRHATATSRSGAGTGR